MISSMDLFLRRDCGGGWVAFASKDWAAVVGVAVEPLAAAPVVVPKRPPVDGAAVVVIVLAPVVVPVAAAGLDAAGLAPKSPPVAGVEGSDAELDVADGLPKRPPVIEGRPEDSAGLLVAGPPKSDEVVPEAAGATVEAGVALEPVPAPNNPSLAVEEGAWVEAGVIVFPKRLPAGFEAPVPPNKDEPPAVGAGAAGIATMMLR